MCLSIRASESIKHQSPVEGTEGKAEETLRDRPGYKTTQLPQRLDRRYKGEKIPVTKKDTTLTSRLARLLNPLHLSVGL